MTNERTQKRGFRAIKRVLLVGALLLVVGGVIVIAFAPSVAGRFAARAASEAGSAAVAGEIDIERVALSWSGPTTIGPVEIIDPDGTSVGTTTVTLPMGLLGLATSGALSGGAIDLGTVTVEADLDIVRDERGTNLERALASPGAANQPSTPSPAPTPTPTEPSKPAPSTDAMSRSLVAEIEFDAVRVDYTDTVNQVKEAIELTGTVVVDHDGATTDATVDLATSGTSSGTIAADVAIGRASDGSITELDATSAISGVSTRLIEALGGPRLAALGETLELQASAATENDDLSAAIDLRASNGSVLLRAVRTTDRVTIAETSKIDLPGALLTDLSPALAEQIANAASVATIKSLPRVSVQIDRCDLPLPGSGLSVDADPSTLDLRDASVALVLRTEPIEGQLRPSGAESDAWQPFDTSEVRIEVQGAPMQDGLQITASTDARIDGRPAGAVRVDTSLTSLLDDQGRLLALADDAALPAINGVIELTSVRTELLQPFVTGTELMLREEIGPTVDLRLGAQSVGAIASNEIPTTRIDLAIDAALVSGEAALLASGETVRSRDDAPIRLTLKKAGPTVGRAVPALAERLKGDLPVEITVQRLTLPIASDDPIAGLDVAASAAVGSGSYALGEGQVVSLRRATFGAAIAPETPARLTLNGLVASGLNTATVDADLSLNGATGLDGLQAAVGKNALGELVRALDPDGEIGLTNVPGDLVASFVSPVNEETPERSAAIARIVRSTVGTSAGLSMRLTPGDDATSIAMRLDGAGTDASLDGTITDDGATVGGSGSLRASAADLNAVLGADGARAPVIVEDNAQFAWRLDQTSIDLGDDGVGLPQRAALALTVEAPMHVTLESPPAPEGTKASPPRTAGLSRGFGVRVDAPVRKIAEGAEDADLRVRMTGTILGSGDAILGVLNADAAASAGGALRNATVELRSIRPFHLDRLLGTGQMARQSLGETGTLRISAMPKGSPDVLAITAGIEAPRLTGANISATVAMGDRITLDAPTVLTMRAPKELVTDLLFPAPIAPPDGAARPARNRVSEDVELTLDLRNATIALADDAGAGGPLRRGVFAIDAQASIPSLAVVRPGDEEPVRLEQVQLDLGWDDSARTLSADGRVSRVRHAGVTGSRPTTLSARVRNLAQDDGVLTTDRMRLDVDANLQSFPSVILDALGKQGGVLAAALGPGVTLDADLRNIGRSEAGTEGVLNTTLYATRAASGLNGQITPDQRFIASGPVELKLLEITPDLSAALGSALPAIAQLEKKRSDNPAVVRATGLEVPLDGDLRKLNGDITASLGVVQFRTGDILGGILSQVGGQSSGSAGRRIQPFTVRARKGVLTYDRYALPVGEFEIETVGTIDLVTKRMDLLIYTPLFALTDEIAGSFDTGIAGELGVLDRNTLVPIRVRGSTTSPSVQPDLGLFLEERTESLLENPGSLLDEVLGDKNPLKGLFGPK